MSPQRHVRLFVLLLFVLLTFHSSFGQEAPFTGFDNYVNTALRDWEVPGFSRLNRSPEFFAGRKRVSKTPDWT